MELVEANEAEHVQTTTLKAWHRGDIQMPSRSLTFVASFLDCFPSTSTYI